MRRQSVVNQLLTLGGIEPPSGTPGNGILRAETAGRFRPRRTIEPADRLSQTETAAANLREFRGSDRARKSGRLSRTSWWTIMDSNDEHLQYIIANIGNVAEGSNF